MKSFFFRYQKETDPIEWIFRFTPPVKMNKMSNFGSNKFVMASTQHSATICQYVAETDCVIRDVKIICQGGATKFAHRY